MGAIRFYWQAIKLALRHSLDHTQYVLFVVFLGLGTASYFVPKLAKWETFVSGWQAATFTLGAIILIRLLLAPYWLYLEQAEKLKGTDQKSPPDLSQWAASLDPLNLEQAAFLWCGTSPRGSVLKSESAIHLRYEKLKRAVLQKQLHPDWNDMVRKIFEMNISITQPGGQLADDGKFVGPKTPVRVAELKRYAESIGERPEFLFGPTAATPAPPSPPSTAPETPL